MSDQLSKYVIEFRYRPIASAVDRRGDLADVMTSKSLTEWVIGKDRVDVFNPERNKAIFVSYQNCGIALEGESGSVDSLLTSVQNAVKRLPEQDYQRFGLRLTSYVKTNRPFSSLLKSFQAKLTQENFLNKAPKKVQVDDIALVYDLSAGQEKIHLQVGPMKADQAGGFFSTQEEIPETGVFIDVDIFSQPNPGATFKDARRFVFSARPLAESFCKHVCEIVEAQNAKK